MITIMFDNTCTSWTPHADYNMLFLEMNMKYLHDLFTQRGYLYLNQIYESLGAEWNPDDNNIYWRTDGTYSIAWEFKPMENGDVMITIH